MLKAIWLSILLAITFFTSGQLPHKKHRRQLQADSSSVLEWNDSNTQELPVESVSEAGAEAQSIGILPSPLSANRDVFSNIAAFHFNVVRYRQRGYDQQWSRVLINGLPMNSIADGNIPWSYWSGLNDATKSSQSFFGPAPIDGDFGTVGSTTIIDMRPFRQWPRTQVSYSTANRSYSHRLSVIHAAGFNKKNWASAFSGSLRYGNETYFEGTGTQGASYFFGADKKLTGGNTISIVIFGSASRNARQSPVLSQIIDLTGNYRYNAYWGYQAGRKRNASMATSHVPVCIISLEKRYDNHRTLLLAASLMAGRKTATAPDWYNAADPRPDYYRYLPGYQQDTLLRNELFATYQQDPGLLQINWDRLYEVNRQSEETIHDVDGITGKAVRGLRSHYVLEKRITDIRRTALNCIYNTMPAANLHFSGGCSFQWEQRHLYKQLADLLGGMFYVNWNQFAEDNSVVLQNDLNHPNRLVGEGDHYGYDYSSLHTTACGWAQVTLSGRHIDTYCGMEIGYVNFLRDGHVRNGLFPDNSMGRSPLHEFDEYAFKAGITYKFDGRRYLYLRAIAATRAPLFSDVYLSPSTRDAEQANVQVESLLNAEMGAIHQSPVWRCRISGYYSLLSAGMNIVSFYHDGYRSFVNYALSGIGRLYAGIEAGLEWQCSPAIRLSTAASIGSFVYRGRPQVVVTIDNNDFIAERGIVYLNNFRIGGTPQEAYGAQLAYQSAKRVYANLSVNYFRQQWIDINPLRRTEAALMQLQPGSPAWAEAITQARLPDQYTLDLAFGASVRSRMFTTKHHYLSLYCGINNLLNKKNIVAGAFEQMRFDAASGNINKFPPRFYYASGINYSLNVNVRL